MHSIGTDQPHAMLCYEVAHVPRPADGSAWRGGGGGGAAGGWCENKDDIDCAPIVTDVDSGIYFRPEPGGKRLILT